jgi:hypothetical protein
MGASDKAGLTHPSNVDSALRTKGLTIVLAAIVLTTSLYANIAHMLGLQWFFRFVPPFTGRDSWMMDHLGGEHRWIATALAAGKGFSDPFREPTGPSAWVAPVLPFIQAVPMAIGGIRLATIAVAMLQNMSLIFTGWVVLRAARRSDWRGAPVTAVVLFIGATWYHFFSCYQSTHDPWLVMFLIGVLVLMADRLCAKSPGFRASTGWGLLGGMAAISGPVLAPVWGVLTLFIARSSRTRTIFLVSGLVAIVVVAPWTIRNALVFGRFVPIKSNMFYELYQSNVLEPDGVLRLSTAYGHPLNDTEERERYRELGEMRYVENARELFLGALGRDPVKYFERVGNRLLAVTVIYCPYSEYDAGLSLLLGYLIHPLPFYGLLLTLMRPGWAGDRHKTITVIVYLTYLVPYVFVAYYDRYGLPLLGIKVLFVFWGAENLGWLLTGRVKAGGASPGIVRK